MGKETFKMSRPRKTNEEKMDLQNLVGSECGRSNPLVQLTSHFLLDPTHEGLSSSSTQANEMVQEYLEGIYGPKTQTFSMDSLFQELHDIESHQKQVPAERELPNVDSGLTTIDSVWVHGYMGARKPFYEGYQEEQVWHVPPFKSDVPQVQEVCHPGFNSIWTQEYIDYDEHNIDRDENWLPEDEGDEGKRSTLQELAKHFVNTVDDPKLKCSKFMKFMQQIGNGDVSVSGGEVVEHRESGLNGMAEIEGCSRVIRTSITGLESIP